MLNILIIKKRSIFQSLYPNHNPTIQKIHSGYVPPLDGVVIFLCSYILIYLVNPKSLFFNFHILIPSLAILIVGVIEDLYGKSPPTLRFLIIFFGSITYCSYTNNLPSLEFFIIGEIINNNNFIKILFFSICITGISNGLNILDGMNGLSGFTCIAILLSILILLSNGSLSGVYFEVYALIIFTIIFLIFNFPFGKIFLGDAGAYWLGWILSIMVIEIYSHSDFNTWGAAIILIYPGMEVITSTIRKIYSKKNPFYPDPDHLHLKLYSLLKGFSENKKKFSYLTTIYLIPIYLNPIFFIYLSQKINFISDFYLFIISGLVYLIFFILVPKNKN